MTDRQTPGDMFGLPRLGLRLGVIGNRDLTGADIDAVRRQVRHVLQQIVEATEAVRADLLTSRGSRLYADMPPAYFLIDSLAEGADQLVAEEALPLGFRLRCPLPFPEGQYKQRFNIETSPDSRENFDRLVAHDDAEALLIELDCPSDEHNKNKGYAAAADLLLDNADLVLAVHDPDREIKEGGTRHSLIKAEKRELMDIDFNYHELTLFSLIKAEKRELMVIEINIRNPAETLIWLPATRSRRQSERRPVSELATQIMGLIKPPEFESRPLWLRRLRKLFASSNNDNDATTADSSLDAEETDRLKRFVREPLVHDQGPAYRLAMTLNRFLSWPWKGLFWLARDKTPVPAQESRQSAANPIVESARSPYRQQFHIFDRLAGHYMDIYRGSFTLNYLLGAMAVLFALLSYFNPWNEVLWLRGEMAALIIIFGTFVSSRWWHWHQRALDYRFLAEYFRHMEMLAPLARTAPLIRPAAYNRHHDPSNTWMGWYMRAFIRGQGPFSTFRNPEGRPSRMQYQSDYLLALKNVMRSEWLEDQKSYHQRSSARYKRLELYTQVLMMALFLITSAFVANHMVHAQSGHPDGTADVSPGSAMTVQATPIDDDSSESQSPQWRPGASLTIIVAALPAFLAALHAISVQGEFERLSERSESAAEHLKDVIKTLEDLEAPSEGSFTLVLSDHALAISHFMLDEVLDWRIIYKAHAVPVT